MKDIIKLIDSTLENNQETGFRKHLGASIIGKECAREVWYNFRWFKIIKHSGRLLRLFDRGHLEEHRFIKFLKLAGVKISETDSSGEQFKILEHSGHFSGSLDGIGNLKNEIFLLEFKTHNDKSFGKLKKEGLLKSKFEHYIQMQIYMFKANLKKGLYLAVNKNNDELFSEIINLDEYTASRYIDRAGEIIFSKTAPEKQSKDPSYWRCKFCNYHSVCHKNEKPDLNCRTCKFSKPINGKGHRVWSCELNKDEIHIKQLGCELYEQIDC